MSVVVNRFALISHVRSDGVRCVSVCYIRHGSAMTPVTKWQNGKLQWYIASICMNACVVLGRQAARTVGPRDGRCKNVHSKSISAAELSSFAKRLHLSG